MPAWSHRVLSQRASDAGFLFRSFQKAAFLPNPTAFRFASKGGLEPLEVNRWRRHTTYFAESFSSFSLHGRKRLFSVNARLSSAQTVEEILKEILPSASGCLDSCAQDSNGLNFGVAVEALSRFDQQTLLLAAERLAFFYSLEKEKLWHLSWKRENPPSATETETIRKVVFWCLCAFLKKVSTSRGTAASETLSVVPKCPVSVQFKGSFHERPSLRFPLQPVNSRGKAKSEGSESLLLKATSALKTSRASQLCGVPSLQRPLLLLLLAAILKSDLSTRSSIVEEAVSALASSSKSLGPVQGGVRRNFPSGRRGPHVGYEAASLKSTTALLLPLCFFKILRVLSTEQGTKNTRGENEERWPKYPAATRQIHRRLEILRVYALMLLPLFEGSSTSVLRNANFAEGDVSAQCLAVPAPDMRPLIESVRSFVEEWMESHEAREWRKCILTFLGGHLWTGDSSCSESSIDKKGLSERSRSQQLTGVVVLAPVSLEAFRFLEDSALEGLSAVQSCRLLWVLTRFLYLSKMLHLQQISAFQTTKWEAFLKSPESSESAPRQFSSRQLTERSVDLCVSSLATSAEALLRRLTLALREDGLNKGALFLSPRDAADVTRDACRVLEFIASSDRKPRAGLSNLSLLAGATEALAAGALAASFAFESLSPRDASTLLCAAAKGASLCNEIAEKQNKENGKDRSKTDKKESPSLSYSLNTLFERATRVLLLTETNDRKMRVQKRQTAEEAFASIEFGSLLNHAAPEEVSLISWSLLAWQRLSRSEASRFSSLSLPLSRSVDDQDEDEDEDEDEDGLAKALCLAVIARALKERVLPSRCFGESSSAMALLALAVNADATTHLLWRKAEKNEDYEKAAKLVRVACERVLAGIRCEVGSQRFVQKDLQPRSLHSLVRAVCLLARVHAGFACQVDSGFLLDDSSSRNKDFALSETRLPSPRFKDEALVSQLLRTLQSLERRSMQWCSEEGVCQLAWCMSTAGVRHEKLLLGLLFQISASFSSVKSKHFAALLCSLSDLQMLRLTPVDPVTKGLRPQNFKPPLPSRQANATESSAEAKLRLLFSLTDEFERRVQVSEASSGIRISERKSLSLFEGAQCLRALAVAALANAEGAVLSRHSPAVAASSAKIALHALDAITRVLQRVNFAPLVEGSDSTRSRGKTHALVGAGQRVVGANGGAGLPQVGRGLQMQLKSTEALTRLAERKREGAAGWHAFLSQLFQTSQVVALLSGRKALLERISHSTSKRSNFNDVVSVWTAKAGPDCMRQCRILPPAVQTAAREAFHSVGRPVTRSSLQARVANLLRLAGVSFVEEVRTPEGLSIDFEILLTSSVQRQKQRRVAFEVDGPSHFVFECGSAAMKTQMLQSFGWTVLNLPVIDARTSALAGEDSVLAANLRALVHSVHAECEANRLNSISER